jgi:ankyrin repeat protein
VVRALPTAVSLLLLAGCASGDGEAARRTPAPSATTSTAAPSTATDTTAPATEPATPTPDPARQPVLDRRLIRAADDHDLEAAARLIAAGADVNRKDDTVQSAYLIATSEVGDDPRLLSMTLEAGADVRSLDSFDGTGLIRAADRGFPAVVRRLLRTDIRIDHVNNLGWTALHEAVILGDGTRPYVRVVRLLVEAGADVNKPSRRDGIRPLQHAERRGFTAVAQVLREAGAR